MLACSELAAEEGKAVLRQLGCLCCKAKPEQMADSYHQDIFVESLVWAVCPPCHTNTGHGPLNNVKDITRTQGLCAAWLCVQWWAALWGLFWAGNVLVGKRKLTTCIACSELIWFDFAVPELGADWKCLERAQVPRRGICSFLIVTFLLMTWSDA